MGVTKVIGQRSQQMKNTTKHETEENIFLQLYIKVQGPGRRVHSSLKLAHKIKGTGELMQENKMFF